MSQWIYGKMELVPIYKCDSLVIFRRVWHCREFYSQFLPFLGTFKFVCIFFSVRTIVVIDLGYLCNFIVWIFWKCVAVRISACQQIGWFLNNFVKGKIHKIKDKTRKSARLNGENRNRTETKLSSVYVHPIWCTSKCARTNRKNSKQESNVTSYSTSYKQ